MTRSTNAERECFAPTSWSILAKMSLESVIEIFCFMLPYYYFGPCDATTVATVTCFLSATRV